MVSIHHIFVGIPLANDQTSSSFKRHCPLPRRLVLAVRCHRHSFRYGSLVCQNSTTHGTGIIRFDQCDCYDDWSDRRLHMGVHLTQVWPEASPNILACICLFEIIPLYGLLGYLDIVKRWGVIGLQQKWEMYPLGAVYGFVLGGLSSYCRSLFGELIPPGNEATFYALYAITDKGSSVFGPAIVGAIVDRTGEIRPAFWFLAVLVGLPAPLIYFVDVERGKKEGAKLAEVIEGFRGESTEASEAQSLLVSEDEGEYEGRTRG
jgi:hypothetical protein